MLKSIRGMRVSQAKGEELAQKGYDIYISPSSGTFVRTDNLTLEDATYNVYTTGAHEQKIPSDAFRW